MGELEQPSQPEKANNESVWGHSLTNRQRVLLHTQPLVTLQQKWKLGADDQSHYDALTLAIKVFDTIIDRSGFGNEVTDETIADALNPLLVAFDDGKKIQSENSRYQQVVERLIGYLRNDANRSRAFQVDYSEFNKKSQLVRKVLRFKLLKQIHGFSGELVYQLSSAAINLFLNALDLDVESAQEANEAVVRFQLERGKFDQARAFAENARGQSLRFDEKIRKIIAQTKRDIQKVDWRNEVDQLLLEAMSHVEERLRIEQEIIGSAETKLDSTNLDTDERQTVIDVIRLMRDCVYRHTELNRQLMPARNHFIEQQARQCFNETIVAQPVHLRDDILQPLLSMKQAEVAEFGRFAISLLHGPQQQKLLSLTELVHWQLQPLRTNSGGEVVVEQFDLEESCVDTRRFDDETLELSEKVLTEVDQPVLLSELIARMEDEGCPESVQDAIILQILDLFASEDEVDTPQAAEIEIFELSGLNHHRVHGDELLISPCVPTTCEVGDHG